MPNKRWEEFEWDDENKKNGNLQHLRDHGIFHEYDFQKDERRFDDVYIMTGRTNRGRRLRLVFQDKGKGLARIFTGWDLKSVKKGKR